MKRARDPDLIPAAMAARDLTYREMGLLVGCSEGKVRQFAAGQPLDPSIARRAARVLRRPVDELFADVESSDEQTTDDHEAAA